MTTKTVSDRYGSDEVASMSGAPPAADLRTIVLNKVSWGAVLAGAVIALVTQLLINLLGTGIGTATLDPGTSDNPSAAAFSTGAAIWFIASGVLASLAGGYAAGRLSGQPKTSSAGWHGLTTWAVTTLVIFYLLTSTLGGLLGGAYRTVAGVAGGLAGTAATAAQTAGEIAGPGLVGVTDPFASIEQSLRSATGGTDPAALRDAAVSALRAVLTGDEAQADQARDQAAQALARAQNIPLDQARGDVQRYEQQYRQAVEAAKEQATAAADTAAKAVSQGALFATLGLVLGAAAAWFGGRMGAVDPAPSRRAV